MAGIFDKARHIVAQPVGWGAQAVGHALNLGGLAPNETASRAIGIGKAITNPNMVYTGAINPLNPDFARASGGTNWKTVASSVAPASAPPRVLGASANQPGVPDSGIYGAGGSGSAYDPNTDPNALAQHRGIISNLLNTFSQAYNDIMGRIDALAAEKKSQLEQNYGQQGEQLGKDFASTSQGINQAYQGRGAFDSSYRATDQGQAQDAYNQAVKQLGQSEQGDLGSLGSWVATTKAGLSSARPDVNPGDYGTVSDLMTIQDNVNAALKALQASSAGLGTIPENVAGLNAITPTQQTGSDMLKAQLAKLAGINTDPQTKRAIAATTIANSGADHQPWMDYFEQQLQATHSQPVA